MDMTAVELESVLSKFARRKAALVNGKADNFVECLETACFLKHVQIAPNTESCYVKALVIMTTL